MNMTLGLKKMRLNQISAMLTAMVPPHFKPVISHYNDLPILS
jgi:hypothetical protein